MKLPFPPSNRRMWLTSTSTLLLSLGLKEAAYGAQVQAVRVWPADDYTRITLESDSPLSAKYCLTQTPKRFIIELPKLDSNAILYELSKKVQPGDPYIQRIEVSKTKANLIRVVIELSQDIDPQVFSLPPVAAYQHRLVFDLYPKHHPSSATELLKDHPLKSTEPGAAIDPLANLAPPAAPPPLPEAASSIASKQSIPLLPPATDPLGDFITALNQPTTHVAKTPAHTKLPPRSSLYKPARLTILAIDPGHGGEDPGAIGPSGLKEKNIVLSIAKRLRERLEDHPNIRVMLTRDSDFFVPLHERVRKARSVQADLFISIHADAFLNQEARGASVFALSERGASSAAAKWLAQKENASDLVGGINIKAKDQVILRTLLDMSTTAQIKSSLKLGKEILGRIGKVGQLHKNGVEQASFAVLKAPDIPSILVETGFISNPEEEAKLADAAYQEKIADALLSGILQYFIKHPPLPRQRPV